MKICYLDESGHCGEKTNKNQPVETIAGVISDFTKIFKTQREHQDVLGILRNMGVEIDELKASEIYRGRKEWGGVDPKFRDLVFNALLTWATERKCKFIICPIDSIEFFRRKRKGCQICNKFQFPFEAAAFNAVLAIQREFSKIKKNKGKTIVIFDEQKKHDDRFIRLFENDLSFTDGYTGYKKPPRAKALPRLDQIVDIPHFSKSHLAVLIQIADMAAFITNRYIDLCLAGGNEKYLGEKNKIKKWYATIKSSMIKPSSINPKGNDKLIKFYSELRPNGWLPK